MGKQDSQDPADPILLTIDEVCALTHTSRVSIHRAVKRKAFPAPVVLFAEPGQGGGRGRCHRWRRDEVLAHLDALPRSTDLGPAA